MASCDAAMKKILVSVILILAVSPFWPADCASREERSQLDLKQNSLHCKQK